MRSGFLCQVHYDAKAHVNKANYLVHQGQLDKAKDLYLEAIGVEEDCVEAIYNLGWTRSQEEEEEDEDEEEEEDA